MNKIWCCLFLIVFTITSASSQTISKNWQLEASADNPSQQELFGEATAIHLKEGRFNFLREEGGDTLSSGDYLYQNKLLVLFYNTPKDTIQNLRVSELSDSSMIISSKGKNYNLKVQKK